MSDYDFRPGGSLKLKGGVAEGGVVKKLVHFGFRTFITIADPGLLAYRKKKSKSKTTISAKGEGPEVSKDLASQIDIKDESPEGSGRGSPALAGSSSSSRKTEAEKRFEEVQKRRVCTKYI